MKVIDGRWPARAAASRSGSCRVMIIERRRCVQDDSRHEDSWRCAWPDLGEEHGQLLIGGEDASRPAVDRLDRTHALSPGQLLDGNLEPSLGG